MLKHWLCMPGGWLRGRAVLKHWLCGSGVPSGRVRGGGLPGSWT